MIYLAIFLIVVLSTMVSIIFLHPYIKSTWPCRHMGLHLEPKEKTITGIIIKGKCPRCHEEVMQDGQGNWF